MHHASANRVQKDILLIFAFFSQILFIKQKNVDNISLNLSGI